MLFLKNLKFDPLFNGNNISNNQEFDIYLKRLGYSFKNNDHEFSNYVSLKDKKINFIKDAGSPPNKKIFRRTPSGCSFLNLFHERKYLLMPVIMMIKM